MLAATSWFRRSAVALSALVIASACSGTGSGVPSGSSGGLTNVRLASVGPISPLLSFLWIGQYFGWYKQEGINISFEPSQGGGDAIQKLVAGDVDVTLPPPSNLLASAAQGRELPVIGVYLLRRTGQYQFAVLPNSPLHSLSDIKGKKIGVVSLGDEGVTFTKAAVRSLGLPESAVTIVPVGAAGEAAAALQQGHVDALAHPIAQTSLVQALGVKLRFLPNPSFASSVFGNELTVRRDYMTEHPNVVKGLDRVIAKATLFYETNPEAAMAIHYKLFPQTLPTGLTVEQAVKRAAAQAQPTIRTFLFNNKKCREFGCNEKSEWETYAYTYVGLSHKEIPDVTKYYTNMAIPYANGFNQGQIIQLAKNFDTNALIKQIGH